MTGHIASKVKYGYMGLVLWLSACSSGGDGESRPAPETPEACPVPQTAESDPPERLAFKQISVAFNQRCAAANDGAVYGWNRFEGPARVEGLSHVRTVDAREQCVLREGGGALCWDHFGVYRPTNLPDTCNIQAFVGSFSLDYALTDQGDVLCVKRNPDLCESSEPGEVARVLGISEARGIARGGAGYTCAVLSSGAVNCWGGPAETPPKALEISDAVAVVGAEDAPRICALHSNGTVSCWRDDSEPALVSSLNDVVSLAAGGGHACAVLADGSVRCWGENRYGELGDGTKTDSETPVEVLGIRDAVQVSIARYASCALHADGTASCWGYQTARDEHGWAMDSAVPVPVPLP